jgi:hypothetical protein
VGRGKLEGEAYCYKGKSFSLGSLLLFLINRVKDNL